MFIDDVVNVVEQYCATTGGVLVRSSFEPAMLLTKKKGPVGGVVVRLVCEISFEGPVRMSFKERGGLCRALGLERSEGSGEFAEGVTVLADLQAPLFR